MWWKYAGFGRVIILNELKEDTFEASAEGKNTHVRPGRLNKVQVAGQSYNTVWGYQKSVMVSLSDKRQLERPGTRADVNLTWGRLLGPPVPDTWAFEFAISAPENEHAEVSGRIPLSTPRGRRAIVRFTFHYALDDNRDVWYAVKTDDFDWHKEVWLPGPTQRLGDAPAVRSISPLVHAN